MSGIEQQPCCCDNLHPCCASWDDLPICQYDPTGSSVACNPYNEPELGPTERIYSKGCFESEEKCIEHYTGRGPNLSISYKADMPCEYPWPEGLCEPEECVKRCITFACGDCGSYISSCTLIPCDEPCDEGTSDCEPEPCCAPPPVKFCCCVEQSLGPNCTTAVNCTTALQAADGTFTCDDSAPSGSIKACALVDDCEQCTQTGINLCCTSSFGFIPGGNFNDYSYLTASCCRINCGDCDDFIDFCLNGNNDNCAEYICSCKGRLDVVVDNGPHYTQALCTSGGWWPPNAPPLCSNGLLQCGNQPPNTERRSSIYLCDLLPSGDYDCAGAIAQAEAWLNGNCNCDVVEPPVVPPLPGGSIEVCGICGDTSGVQNAQIAYPDNNPRKGYVYVNGVAILNTTFLFGYGERHLK